jgi:putative methyltransferase (TIGR04325 family)
MLSLNNFVRNISPPFIFKILKSVFSNQTKFYGNFNNWYDAKSICQNGYESNKILQKVFESTLKVKNGEAVFERDSVIFDEIKYSWPVTSSLMLAAALGNGKLNVLDFGGALGSHYYQNKKFLSLLTKVRWNIVEQENFVKIGKIHFQSDTLKFYLTISDYIFDNTPNIVILSSVLQYLPEPLSILKDIVNLNARVVVIDRTPYTKNQKNEVKIQIVADDIYKANYPCHFFVENEIIKLFKNADYTLLEAFNSIDKFGDMSRWKGHIFIKN